MPTLRRARSEDWYSRKGILAHVRDSYRAAFVRSREELFRSAERHLATVYDQLEP